MKKIKAEDLLRKYEAGEANDEERATVESWYLQQKSTEVPAAEELLEDHFVIKNAFIRHIHHRPRMLRAWRRVAAAAVVLMAIAVSLYLYNHADTDPSTIDRAPLANDIAPGGNRATLILGDGRSIQLSDDQEGVVIEADQIAYKDGGIVSTGNSGTTTAFNTIATPRGGQYQIVLPDGTEVWLNAASSLTYPISFDGPQRKVVLQGEGYFEVAKNEKQPFVVTSKGQDVTVLGTHFNINSYDDEEAIRTTLLEGSVQVSKQLSSIQLSPGEQSAVLPNSDLIQVRTIDPEAVIAWKSGYFIFNDEPLESIMRQVAKWYDVDVRYEPGLPNLKFGGIISRANPISAVLKLMERTGTVRFHIEHKEITVLRPS